MVCMAVILALWEIQIEGKDGWAAKSPGLSRRGGSLS